MEIHIRTNVDAAARLLSEISIHGIAHYAVRPVDREQVEIVFLSLSEHQKKLLAYSLKKYRYIATTIW